MANRFDMVIDGGREFSEYLRQVRPMFSATVRDSMKVISLHLVTRARQNAPVDTGDLRKSIEARVLSSSTGFTVRLDSDVSYADRMHEQLVPFGDRSPLLQRRRRSLEQPQTPEGGTGGKYFERILNFHLATYRSYIRDMLAENLGNAQATIRVKPTTRPIKRS